MKKIVIIGCIVCIALLVSACSSSQQNKQIAKGEKITVYKSPTCGCCGEWISYMEKNGFEVETIMLMDMSPIKEEYNIPSNMESCHTAVMDGYFIEGHVPVDVIHDLLEEQPDIDGVALPRMPSGSPGMPGPKRGTWTFYASTNGTFSEYLKI